MYSPVRVCISNIDEAKLLAGWSDFQAASVAKLRLDGLARKTIQRDPSLVRIPRSELRGILITRFDELRIPGKELYEFRNCRQKMGSRFGNS